MRSYIEDLSEKDIALIKALIFGEGFGVLEKVIERYLQVAAIAIGRTEGLSDSEMITAQRRFQGEDEMYQKIFKRIKPLFDAKPEEEPNSTNFLYKN